MYFIFFSAHQQYELGICTGVKMIKNDNEALKRISFKNLIKVYTKAIVNVHCIVSNTNDTNNSQKTKQKLLNQRRCV